MHPRPRSPALGGLALLLALAAPAAAAPGDYFAIRVVDEATGRGVPLVELKSVHEASWWTDSAGVVAFHEPGMMDTEVFLHVQSPGYAYPADAFGNRGLKVTPRAGAALTIPLRRVNLAERLYRITGAGIYRDSVLLGLPVPTRQPVINGLVTGQDTVVATPYRGRIHWFWGDTNRVGYPLGNFGTSSATSEWPGRGGLDPAVGVDLTYFVDQAGFSRVMVPDPGYGMRWVEAPVVVRDDDGRDRLATRVAVQRHLGDAQEWHLLVFDDARGVFASIQKWELHDPHQSAHPFRARVGGVDYVYLFPEYRVPATLRALRDLGCYEALTCVAGDGRWRGNATEIERDDAGRPRFTWKRGADRLGWGRLQELRAPQRIGPDDYYPGMRGFENGAALQRGPESVSWNAHRRRWVSLSADRPGEVWFAEADTPLGPWGFARRVAEHGAYNFYNLAEHAFLAQDGGRLVYFEGTYTDAFSSARARTPRYDYNQLMYRLDLADERLDLPAAVYRLHRADGTTDYGVRAQVAEAARAGRPLEVGWFALSPERRRPGTVAVYRHEQDGVVALTTTAPEPEAQPLFLGVPEAGQARPKGVDGRWHCRARGEGDPGEGLALEFEFRSTGEQIAVLGGRGEPCGSGTFHNGHLAVQVLLDGRRFDCIATVTEGKFSGSWEGAAGDDRGTWTGVWQDPTPAELKSPDLVGLRRFRNAATGAVTYATAEGATAAGLEPQGPALCRVWRARHARPPMDWAAEPIPATGP